MLAPQFQKAEMSSISQIETTVWIIAGILIATIMIVASAIYGMQELDGLILG
jgi:hypothetical protein